MGKLISFFFIFSVCTFTCYHEVQAATCPNNFLTTFNGGNSQDGNMFDLTNLSQYPLVVQALDVHLLESDIGVRPFEIWTKVGSYVGFEADPGAWALRFSTPDNFADGIKQVTLPKASWIYINPGATIGMYVTRTEPGETVKLQYTNGVFDQDDGVLKVTSGIGLYYPFGYSFSPRTWNGRIYYSCCSETSTVVVNCALTQTLTTDPNQCCATQSYGPVLAFTANCASVAPLQTSGLPSGSCFPTGTTNTFVAPNSGGAYSTCSWTYNVVDNQDPVITCPANQVVNALPNQCGTPVTFTPTATDNCGISGIVSDPPSGFFFTTGTQTVTSTAIDTSGRSASCTFTVTVNDPSNHCLCGNGILDTGEQCEINQLGVQTCASRGFPDGGVLDCTNCQFDTSRCAVCGDGRIDGNEECDGTNFNSQTCQSFGFSSGQLSCSSSCRLVKTGCFTCGDGVVNSPAEQCDGSIPNGVTCQTVLGGSSIAYTGSLRCYPDSCRYDTTQCILPKITKPDATTVTKQYLGITVAATGFVTDKRVTVTFRDGMGHSKSYSGLVLALPAGSFSAVFQVPFPMQPSTQWKVTVKGETSLYSVDSPAFVVQ